MSTKIEWTRGADGKPGMTWNPTLGCSKVGDPDEGECSRCYAINVAHRGLTPAHEGLTVKREGERLDWTGVVRCLPERLEVPLRRHKPTTWFVDSMSDLFHPDVPSSFIGSVFSVMARAEQHTFQVLTKRPQRMRVWTHDYYHRERVTVLPNVWLGTSIGENKYAFRANHLRATLATIRFLSLEPLLGPLPSVDLDGIDWVIVGGESGPDARPVHPDWVRNIRDRCIAAGVPFFFKQWGAWLPEGQATYGPLSEASFWSRTLVHPDGSLRYSPKSAGVFRVGKKTAGRTLDGRTWDEMPERMRS